MELLSIAAFVPTGTVTSEWTEGGFYRDVMDIPDSALLGLFALGMFTIYLLLRKK